MHIFNKVFKTFFDILQNFFFTFIMSNEQLILDNQEKELEKCTWLSSSFSSSIFNEVCSAF